MRDGIGDRFQKETKYDPYNLGGHTLDRGRRPEPFKDYPEDTQRESLPEPHASSTNNLWSLLQQRRSRRVYEEAATMSQHDLALLLWATQGVTARHGEYLFRTAPSAGALYPVETYLLIRTVKGIGAGIYHFRPHRFDLELLKIGDFSRQLATAALSQAMILNAQVTFLWTAVVQRSKWKYDQRAYRYIYLDAGHIAQNLYLAAEDIGLGVCAIGAFFDDMVNELIGIDGQEETVIYMATVGIQRRKKGGE